MSVDRRTRFDGETESVDPVEFFSRQLRAAFDSSAGRLEQAAAFLDPTPLAIEVDGADWTLRADSGRITVTSSDPFDAGRMTIDHGQLNDLVNDQVTPMGWLSNGTLKLTGGARLSNVLNWWLLLRAALDGTTPHTPGAITLTDDLGQPLDLGHAFEPDDPPEAMRRFIEQAGYLRIKRLFTEAEMAAVSTDMDRAAPGYSQGDGRSWWAKLEDGTDALVRMQAFDQESEAVAALVTDDRLQRIAGLTGDDHRWGSRTGNRIEALFKPLGVAKGISDIPWHKDCSLGRHSYDCCSLTVGISVTGADATSGQLKVVAGSHRALVWPAPSLQPGLDLPVVDLPTETGDITIHLSCTLHMAQPPVERPRRVMYTGFALPPKDAAAAFAGRQKLRAVREAAPLTVSQPAAT